MCVALELSADEGNHTSRSVLLTAKTLQLGWRPPFDGKCRVIGSAGGGPSRVVRALRRRGRTDNSLSFLSRGSHSEVEQANYSEESTEQAGFEKGAETGSPV